MEGKHINGVFRGEMICVGTSAEFMSLPYEYATTHRNMAGSLNTHQPPEFPELFYF